MAQLLLRNDEAQASLCLQGICYNLLFVYNLTFWIRGRNNFFFSSPVFDLKIHLLLCSFLLSPHPSKICLLSRSCLGAYSYAKLCKMTRHSRGGVVVGSQCSRSAGTPNPPAVSALQTVAGIGRGSGRTLCLGNQVGQG